MPVDVSVVVGVSADPDRARNWEWVRPHYLELGWQIAEVDGLDTDGRWRKGAQYAIGVEASAGATLVIADADCFVDPTVLVAGAREVADGAAWVMPHGRVYRLSALQTRLVQRQQPPPPAPRAVAGRNHDGPRGGGITILARKAWEVAPIDPRFWGWGGEDISWARALTTLVGPQVRFGSPMWHFWHEPLPRWPGRRANPDNEALAARYADADGDITAMRLLVDECR